jgi:pimeloyl-ACP methyl ester carboxylesterase
MTRIVTLIGVLFALAGCASRGEINAVDLEPGHLPPPNITLNIPGLGPCTDNPDRRLHFDATQPLNVLVHGCFGSSGQFRSLAQVLAFHGQQSACFTYDDRAKLRHSAAELRSALKQLTEQSNVPLLTVIGHSQGALIARNSLTDTPPTTSTALPANLRLVTISGPFSGIESARTCGKVWLYPLTLGVVPLSCYLATGAKWTDITYSSRFIHEPGVLARQVSSYLKIDTDERGTCRREKAGRCVEDDDVFSLAEQRNALVENDSRIKRVEVNAGHVEIVGDERGPPTKLIGILQDQGVIYPTAAERLSAFNLLLSLAYKDE